MSSSAGGSSSALSTLAQKPRQVRIKTALPEDRLAFKAMHMSERLSTPFEMVLELYSDDPAIDFDAVLGHNVTVGLERNAGGERYFNGYVTSFGHAGAKARQYVYRAVARPWLWFLTQTRNSRIFHGENAVDIAKKIFDEHGFGDYRFDVSRSPEPYEYCVQYDESDFDFVNRLFEREGIYYFFEHENGRHEMHIVDKMDAHPKEPGYDEMEFVVADSVMGLRREGITAWTQSQQVLPTRFVTQDYDFKKPRADLTSQHAISRGHAASNLEVYQYPGEYVEPGAGQAYATLRAEERQSSFDMASAETNVRGVKTGFRFKMFNNPIPALDQEYLVTSAVYRLEGDDYYSVSAGGGAPQETYSCSFTAMPASGTYRPPHRTPRPRIPGPQTAVVRNDTKGEEIEPDEFGRVKVVFEWEREGKSSCWVRVSQAWAGKGWGAMMIPRDGQEVIVEFLDGNPDRPIITGRVYNGSSEPPYPPKDKPTVTTFKTNSSKGGGGFNEIRFDDEKGAESVFHHQEKDLDVRTKNVRKTFVGNTNHEYVAGSEFVEVNDSRHLTVADEYRLTTGGVISTQAGDSIYAVSDGDIAMESRMDTHLKAGMKAVIEAGAGLTIKSGGNFITLGPAGIHIKGTMVFINSGGSALSGPGERSETAEEPAHALQDNAGEISEKARGRSRTPTPTELDSHPVARALLGGAQSGAPFCKVCSQMAGGGEG